LYQFSVQMSVYADCACDKALAQTAITSRPFIFQIRDDKRSPEPR